MAGRALTPPGRLLERAALQHVARQEADRKSVTLGAVPCGSTRSEGWDRGGKFARYRMLESLREVVFVAQDRVLVEQFTRQDGGRWILARALPFPSRLLVRRRP